MEPMTIAALAGTNLLGGMLGSRASKQAAQMQADATRYAADLQNQQFQQTRADQMPWLDYGRESLGTLRGMTQAGGEFARPLSVGDVTAEPGYQFGMDEGLKSVTRALPRMYGADSGATLKALTRFGTDYASTKYGDAWNRANADRGFRYNALAGGAGIGQQTATNLGNVGMGYANTLGNLATSGAAASAAGVVGGANALSSGINNAGNTYMTYSLLNKFMPTGGGGAAATPSATPPGGFGWYKG